MRARIPLLLLLAVTACDTNLLAPVDPDAPVDLSYQLIPSGDPSFPAGIVLQWTAPGSGRAVTYDVYARSSVHEEFGLRATTTSVSFHDAGYPQLEYYVQALDDQRQEMGSTDAIRVDERNRLPAPRALTSTTLNGGVELAWDRNAYLADPEVFDFYRIYSTAWTASQGCVESSWSLEGTTVSDGFVARNLPNGTTRCFAVSAISRDGHESVWSNVREDTPRFDARSIVLDAQDTRRLSSGFVFMPGGSTPFGSVVADTTAGADVVLERRDGALWFRAPRSESRVALYGVSPISELTSMDRAPTAGYTESHPVRAGFGYVFRVQYADGVRYAGIRVVHVAADYILFDFAFQSQSGNPELLRMP
jgi:hypothetical protein